MELKCKRINSFNDSGKDFVVRLSKQERGILGLNSGFVKVKKGNAVAIAVVKKQFTDLIGFASVCSINGLLAKELKVAENDIITITNDVTQPDIEKYVSQAEFDKRQIVGLKLMEKNKKKAKELIDELFADEQETENEN